MQSEPSKLSFNDIYQICIDLYGDIEGSKIYQDMLKKSNIFNISIAKSTLKYE